MNYKQELPEDVQKSLDAYMERIKAIKWFKPEGVKRDSTDKQIKIALKCFGVEASIEYRALSTPKDWDAAWDAARDAARAACDLLASKTPEAQQKAYKEKYPNGNFLELIPLWEAGLYPVGVVDGKFIVYVPTDAGDVSDLLGK